MGGQRIEIEERVVIVIACEQGELTHVHTQRFGGEPPAVVREIISDGGIRKAPETLLDLLEIAQKKTDGAFATQRAYRRAPGL